ncbi:hypothetical protein [Enterococcus sp. DIV0724b]|uniref:hypothetical protein n=1 Tax=Enterococcus sp. DIV0724b TaxID=2774694 RepID=UPI003D301050
MNHSTTNQANQILKKKSTKLVVVKADDEQYLATKGREVSVLVNHSTTNQARQILRKEASS